MSTIVKYSSGSTYTLVPNKVDIEKIQDLDGQYHIPNTSIVGMMRLGLGVQRITVSGDALDMAACLWHDVVAISFDSGTSYQVVYFAGVPYTSDCWSGIYPYALSLLASPLKEQAATRYPTTGYKWGNQSITGISQAGNVNAFPTIHYLAPLFYAPLSNTLVDFAGQSVTFTRTASKVHNGITYGVNVPIFDNGLYLASDTAQDVATWTPPAAMVRTVAMQIKSRYPSPWSIGGGGVNLLTANQSNAETDTTGVVGWGGTFTRNTVTPLAGTADFKLVSTADGDLYLVTNTTAAAVAAGYWYTVRAFVGMTAAAGRQFRVYVSWYTAADVLVSNDFSSAATFSGVAFTISAAFQCPATATKAYVGVNAVASLTGEILYADSLMIETIPLEIQLWWGNGNRLAINTVNSLIVLTDDNVHWVSAAFPTALYMTGTLTDIVILDDTAHVVTIAVRAETGAWTTGTGTRAGILWGALPLGSFEGSIANLIEFPYVLTSAEYQALDYSSLSLLYNTLYIGNRYAGEIVKGSDKRLLNSNGSDISALLGGTDIAIGASAVTIAQSQGLAARWYVEVKRTDV